MENSFDMSAIPQRYFHVALKATMESGKERDIEIDVLPPKLKFIRKIVHIKKNDETSIEELREAVSQIMSRNKAGTKVPCEYIDELDEDVLNSLLTAYFEWVSETKKN